MNVLFLTLLDFVSIEEHNIYTDLLREFRKNGHLIYVISPVERRTYKSTEMVVEENVKILKLKIGNVQKTNLIEKGLSTITLEQNFIRGIKKYFSKEKFDLILYSTPPITLQKAVEYVKRRDGATTYLLLKDIFPQNAVDMGMLSKKGVKSVLYRYFRKKEKQLYELSDHIGCMSQANVEYVLKHNPELSCNNVEICPNCIEIQDMQLSDYERQRMREKYGIPQGKIVFVYGGNLGKPQGIPFIIKCLEEQIDNEDVFFLIVGDGTEFDKLHKFFEENKPTNMKLLKRLPKEDYDSLVAACDIGMIFLDYRFTIPNFPSRLLSYMQAGVPVLACTDIRTDIGDIITQGNFGCWCQSNSVKSFREAVKNCCECDRELFGEHCISFLKKYYSAEKAFKIIFESYTNKGGKNEQKNHEKRQVISEVY